LRPVRVTDLATARVLLPDALSHAGDDTVLAQTLQPAAGPGNFVELHRVFNTSSRTDITVTYEINGSGTAPAAVSFDDFFFTPVPQSATLLALGMGLGVMGFVRYLAGCAS